MGGSTRRRKPALPNKNDQLGPGGTTTEQKFKQSIGNTELDAALRQWSRFTIMNELICLVFD